MSCNSNFPGFTKQDKNITNLVVTNNAVVNGNSVTCGIHASAQTVSSEIIANNIVTPNLTLLKNDILNIGENALDEILVEINNITFVNVFPYKYDENLNTILPRESLSLNTCNVIAGGKENEINASSIGSSILGGFLNNIITKFPQNCIVNGQKNEIQGFANARNCIVTGIGNTIGSRDSIICAGSDNDINNHTNKCFIGSGTSNRIANSPAPAGLDSFNNAIVGGNLNMIQTANQQCGILIGDANEIRNYCINCSILCGQNNNITGSTTSSINLTNSAILNGNGNLITTTTANSDNCLIMGNFSETIDSSNNIVMVGLGAGTMGSPLLNTADSQFWIGFDGSATAGMYWTGHPVLPTTGAAVEILPSGQLYEVMSTRKGKTNISTLNDSRVNDIISNIRSVSYNAKDDIDTKMHFGFIAEEMHEYFPEAVVYDTDNSPKSIRQIPIISVLLHKIQLLEKRLNSL